LKRDEYVFVSFSLHRVRHEFNECKSSLKCCTKDGGRPSAIGMQMQVVNRSKGAVFKRYGTEHLGKRAH